MANNKIKQIWQGGGAAVNGWLAIPDGFAAETMAQAGWDSVTVDLQHGVQDYMSMVRCFQAMQVHPVVPMVRVPWNEPGIIGKVLDAGAYGVICPMINTVAEAKALVSYCNYPAAWRPVQRADPGRDLWRQHRLPERRRMTRSSACR